MPIFWHRESGAPPPLSPSGVYESPFCMHTRIKIVILISLLFELFPGIHPIKAGEPILPSVILSEAMINPSAVEDTRGEWVEIQNIGEMDINIKNFILISGKNEHTISSDLILEPLELAVLCKEMDPAVNGGINCDYEYASLSFVNSGGSISIKNTPDSTDSMEYPSEAVLEGKSLERIANESGHIWQPGQVMMDSGDFGSPGSENSHLLEDTPGKSSSPSTDIKSYFTGGSLAGIIINETLPNPAGVDNMGGEFIELFNTSSADVDLNGWFLEDASGNSFYFNKTLILPPQAYFVLYGNELAFSLRNTSGSIFLLDKERRLVDNAAFLGSAKSGYSYNRTSGGSFYWTNSLTPGRENSLAPDQEEASTKKISSGEKKASKTEGTETSKSTKLITISDLNNVSKMRNGSLVITTGKVVTDPGIPSKGAFYLQVKKKGILIKTTFDYSLAPGDIIKISGKLHKIKSGVYISVSDAESVEQKSADELSYRSLDEQDIKDNHLEKLIGVPVSLQAKFVRKVFKSLYFEAFGGQKIRAYETSSGSNQESMVPVKDREYELLGIIDKTSAGFRILLSDMKETEALPKLSDSVPAPTQTVNEKFSTRVNKEIKKFGRHSPLLRKHLPPSGKFPVYSTPESKKAETQNMAFVSFESFLRSIYGLL